MEIRWKKGFRGHADAGEVYKELEKIRAEHGRITPELIVERAGDAESPLHREIEQDDSVAAHRWRLERARVVSRNLVEIVISDDGSESERPALINVCIAADDSVDASRAYVPTSEVILNEVLLARATIDALNGLRSWQRRFEMLSGFEPIHDAIEEVTKALNEESSG